MTRTAFRVIQLDISSSTKTLYQICEVTFDAEDRPVAWRNRGIQLLAGSTEDLADILSAIGTALAQEVLGERALHEMGVKMVQG